MNARERVRERGSGSEGKSNRHGDGKRIEKKIKTNIKLESSDISFDFDSTLYLYIMFFSKCKLRRCTMK